MQCHRVSQNSPKNARHSGACPCRRAGVPGAGPAWRGVANDVRSVQRLEASLSCSRWGGRVATSSAISAPPHAQAVQAQLADSDGDLAPSVQASAGGTSQGPGSGWVRPWDWDWDWAQAAPAPRRRQSESDLRRQRRASRVAISARSPPRGPASRRPHARTPAHPQGIAGECLRRQMQIFEPHSVASAHFADCATPMHSHRAAEHGQHGPIGHQDQDSSRRRHAPHVS